MVKRRIINIFIVFSIIILVLVLIRTGLMERAIGLVKDRLSSDGDGAEEKDDYPEYIYETFIDGEGNEVSVKMERKTGTIDGEEVVFYEDTVGSEVIYYRFYKGVISDVDDEKIVFIVDKECLDGDPEDSFFDYEDVEDYELIFYLDEYGSENINGINDRISVNTEMISSTMDLIKIRGKNVRVCDSRYKDPISKCISNQLDFFSR
ncbi:MAG: hypothetical protein K8S14_10320 [Actinomycetia bacterium]|nr:hypothetical protein [Actinomycetes bacterium]